MTDRGLTVERLLAEIKKLRGRIKELEEAEKDFHHVGGLLDQVNSAVISINLKREVTYWNRSAEILFQWPAKKALGRGIVELIVPEEYRGDADKNLRSLRKKGRWSGEFPVKRRDETLFPASVEGTIVRDARGRTAGMVSIIRDISDKKKSEDALEASRDYSRYVLESSLDMIIAVDLKRKITGFNLAAEKTFGYLREEVLGKHIRLLYADPDQGRETHDATLEKGRTVREVLNRRKNGTVFPALISASVLYDAIGNIVGVMGVSRDISLQKKVLESLIESEAKYREVMSQIPGAVYQLLMKKDGTITMPFVSDRAENFYGINTKEIQSHMNLALDMIFPEDLQRVLDSTYESGRSMSIWTGEFRIRLKSGKTLWVSGSSIPRELPDGSILWNGVFIDITARKQAEEALNRSEEKFRNLAEEITEGVCITVGGYNYWMNKAFAETFGYAKEELLGKTAHLVIAPEEIPGLMKRMKARLAGKQLSPYYEAAAVRKDGRRIIVEMSGKKVIFNNLEAIQLVLRDITGRKEAEERIRESEERYRTLVETSPDAIALTDLEGTILITNQQAVRMYGFNSVEEMVGLNVFDYIAPETQDWAWKMLEKTVASGHVANLEYIMLKKDGARFPVELSASLINDARGEPKGFITVVRDITERRRMEEEIQRTQKLESIGLLAGGIAHDFNNILTGILGNISLAKEYTRAEDKIHDRLMKAERASAQARELTQQLLTFSKGGVPIKKVVSIIEMLKDTISLTLSGSAVRCEYGLNDHSWPVEVDEGQIRQVISNIVINAVQAMPGGGVITVRLENIIVESGFPVPAKDGRYICIVIQDHGIGIPREHLQKIFDPYFTTKQKGSGLGLAMSYSIIKKHEGYIDVASESGQGATFSVYLPATRKNMSVGEEETCLSIPPRGEGRVLLMDDDEIVREVAGKLLEHLGYIVDFAAEGAEALRKYRMAMDASRPYSAVLMDLTIPGGMGGKEAIAKLREIDPGVKAIVSSGYSNDPIMAEYRKYGFAGVIEKPYRIVELGRILKDVLNHGNDQPRREPEHA